MRNAIARTTVALGALSLLAACGRQSNSIPGLGVRGPTSATQAVDSRPLSLLSVGVPAQTQKTLLYSFASGSDGAGPQGNLIDVNGVLYGTTYFGGDANNYGTVFKITASGAESVLHRFADSDGAFPEAGLTDVNGVLYGTTTDGGAFNKGSVFKVTTSGAEAVLHSFAGGSDGAFPKAGLTDVNGVLYGTTGGGDANDDGTVFKITTSGNGNRPPPLRRA